MKKGIIVILFLLSVVFITYRIADYNDISSLDYLKKKDLQYVGQEISYSIPHKNNKVQIYRNLEGINVVLLEWRNMLGWKMVEIDKMSFDSGPDWNYVEIELDNNTTISLVYGFFHDNINSYKSLRLINSTDNIDRSPGSNLSFKSGIRAWYLFHEGRSLDPKQFILLDRSSGESIYSIE
ncbi:hypothetical protein [Alkaliphilus oremlandii]|uniref:Uncharacterized protein n=1 Tax=Alkaliphilus oremlandii (strain OhILAs) TaxID=350688 RepID=A8MIZ0_ALKOO|nr:hypothetical protein [Alkaliphilus oremlandii]ABW19772.1 hypothetical protein Clos_2237 [Alkaliphilus oremlandii OhILAs]